MDFKANTCFKFILWTELYSPSSKILVEFLTPSTREWNFL